MLKVTYSISDEDVKLLRTTLDNPCKHCAQCIEHSGFGADECRIGGCAKDSEYHAWWKGLKENKLTSIKREYDSILDTEKELRKLLAENEEAKKEFNEKYGKEVF